jgi:hypothetical protein
MIQPTDGHVKGRNSTSAPGTVRPLLSPRSRRWLGVESPTSSGGPSLGCLRISTSKESHGRVGPISKVGWPEIQAGLLVRYFHDWQRVRPRPRPRSRDRGRPTGPVAGRYAVRVEGGKWGTARRLRGKDGCCCLHG